MPQPRVLILRAPGTNCDQEAAFAFEQVGGRAEFAHVNRLLESPGLVRDFQILCLPGGFSYGDDLGAGRILANQMRHHLAEALAEFKAAGKLILGICNGFQILIKSGVLLADEVGPACRAGLAAAYPVAEVAATAHGSSGLSPTSNSIQSRPAGGTYLTPRATLTLNASGKFEDRWVELQVSGNKCVFLSGIERLYLPIAHAEGKFVPHDEATLGRLDANSQLALRYARLDGGTGPIPYPDNPNGSAANVAGVCDESGRVFGLMPHPERHIDPTHHPRWTRGPLKKRGDGFAVFENAVRYFS